MAERVRIEVGFDGGQVMSALVQPESAEALEQALASGVGAVAVEADDGRYLLAVGRIAYVKRYARDTRVGFGS